MSFKAQAKYIKEGWDVLVILYSGFQHSFGFPYSDVLFFELATPSNLRRRH